MTGQIICHIGPPKTATTSLQISLAAIDRRDFLYVGTFQPRDRNLGSLSQRLHLVCRGKSEPIHLVRHALVSELTAHLNEGKTIFLSEEMFLVDQDNASILEKIAVLRQLLCDLPSRIIITARDPIFALPSYFQEIFSSLPVNLQLNFSDFCRDRRVLCYDYEKLIKLIQSSGFSDITVIDFDSLSAGKISLSDLTGKSEHANIALPLAKHNSGKIGAAPTSRMMPRISLKNFGRLPMVKKMIGTLGLRHWPGYRQFVALLDKVNLRPAAQRELTVPPDVAKYLDAGYQKVRLGLFDQNA